MKLGRSTVAVVTLAVGLTTAAIVFHSQSTIAQTMPTPPSEAATRPAAQISPEAQVLLSKLTEAYGNLKSFETSGTLSIDFDGGGQQKAERAQISGSELAPNRFHHESKGDFLVNSDGKKLIALVEAKNQYLEFDSPASRADGLPMQIAETMMDQNPSLLLSLVPDAGQAIGSNAVSLSQAPDVAIDGKMFNALNVATTDQDTQLLIDPATHLLRRVTHDLMRSYQAQGVPNLKVAKVTVDYPLTAVDPAASDPAFAKKFDWTPPTDAKPMAFDAPQGDDASGLQMQGKPAPQFALKDLSGKTVSLSDYKGQVVVLDFWATSCVPCRIGLPFLDKVAKTHAKDAKVFAINGGEDLATAQTGQKEMGLSLPILLDSDGVASNAYKVTVIPETVIIGKDGIIRKVFLGLTDPANPPAEEATIDSEIDAANKIN